jgi:hypothetical protein
MNGGAIGDIYQSVQTQKKSKFFGISTGTKTKVSDELTGMDDAMEQQISLLIASLRDGVVSAAKTLGIDGAAAMVDAFQLNSARSASRICPATRSRRSWPRSSRRRPTTWRDPRSAGSPPSRRSAKGCSRR